MKNTKRILNEFYVVIKDNGQEEINIEYYGEYRIGLTMKEITKYITAMKNLIQNEAKFSKVKVKDLVNKFHKIAGVNTGGINSNGEGLMYRWDVQRYVNQLFYGTPTYFD